MWKYLWSLWIMTSYATAPVVAILTDIEGTTTSVSFVYDVLFPYAKEHLRNYLLLHATEPSVAQIIDEVATIAEISNPNLEDVANTLLTWMEQDKKMTPLKTLQGMLWKEGYAQGDFQGHVYEDAFEQLQAWKEEGLCLYVYSSGSVAAQKLLFSHSTYGDMTPFFSGYFDTRIGGKREVQSYRNIANELKLVPETILFLSDIEEELDAAKEAGMQTVLIARDKMPTTSRHPVAPDFTL
jgi:enolase-phosphatase E1